MQRCRSGTLTGTAELWAYVPRHSQREGWVAFREQPSPSGMEARAMGFAPP
ncbi:hypothetical protein [Corallococcus carmarthensis]|uniref:hypothetical protein n=1 Tax=Corallococcus carmarthensis TaxID=2316728 RepID=UPI001315344D|nr:hypothetical protein [Corallococcus carmarthensis]NOK16147.1 hypothetical protein [Corallococcus carmarthensis]